MTLAESLAAAVLKRNRLSDTARRKGRRTKARVPWDTIAARYGVRTADWSRVEIATAGATFATLGGPECALKHLQAALGELAGLREIQEQPSGLFAGA